MPKRPGNSSITAARLAVALLSLAALGFFSGCKATKSITSAVVPTGNKSPAKLSEIELREKLAAFYLEFASSAESTTSAAAAKTGDLALRQRLIESRIQAVRKCRDTVFQRQPLAAYADTWALCLQFEAYLKSPTGQEQFGEAQPAMLVAAQRLHEDIASLGELFLKPNELADLKSKLEQFVQDHPYSVQKEIVLPSQEKKSGVPQLGWLLNIPLSPFHAFEGVDKSAIAMHEFALVAGDFSQTARDMPRDLSWELQLILLQTRREAEDVLTKIDAQQTNTQATLRETRQAIADARGVMAELNTSLVTGQATAKSITETVNALDKLSETTAATLKQIHDLYPPKPESAKPEPPSGRPFDILDYARAAQEIGVAATNLTRLLVEAQGTMGAEALTKRINEAQTTLAQTQSLMRGFANHVALLIGVLIVIFFALLFVYRLYASRRLKAGAVQTEKPVSPGAKP
jgi:hypothetical protein